MPDLAACVADLRGLLGQRVSTAEAVRGHHGADISFHTACPPDAVTFPHSTAEVAGVVTICGRHDIPMIPYGVGSSVEGHIAALHGGVCLDLSEMREIVALHEADLDVTVQAGTTRKQLNEHLRATGLFFPIDPGADATIGGMASTRASGTTAVRYGTMRENVLGLTVVLADGRVIKTGGRARKSSAGYDLTRLFVGAEGTLGVITELTVKLHGIPEAVATAICSFPDLAGAVDTAIATIQSGIPIAKIELLDSLQMRAVNIYSRMHYPERPTLFLEFHGSEAGVSEQARRVGEIAEDHGGPDFTWETQPEQRTRLWDARHQAWWAALALRPGAKGMAGDVCVPISRLAECIEATRRDIEEMNVVAPIVGHVGDGNFHVLFIFDPVNAEEARRVNAVNERMIDRALAMGGTCTGEHGIGCGKLLHLRREHGLAADVMAEVKQLFDPRGLMNPGKVVVRQAAIEPAPRRAA